MRTMLVFKDHIITKDLGALPRYNQIRKRKDLYPENRKQKQGDNYSTKLFFLSKVCLNNLILFENPSNALHNTTPDILTLFDPSLFRLKTQNHREFK